MRLRRSRTSIKASSARLFRQDGEADGARRLVILTMASPSTHWIGRGFAPPAPPRRHGLSMAAAHRT